MRLVFCHCRAILADHWGSERESDRPYFKILVGKAVSFALKKQTEMFQNVFQISNCLADQIVDSADFSDRRHQE